MQAFGVLPEIDIGVYHRRYSGTEVLKQCADRQETETVAIHVKDIEGLRSKRHFVEGPNAACTTSQSRLGMGLIDVDACRRRCGTPQISTSAEYGTLPSSGQCWDLAVGESQFSTRRHFFDQWYWADRYAELLDRPCTRSKLQRQHDLQELRNERLEKGWQRNHLKPKKASDASLPLSQQVQVWGAQISCQCSFKDSRQCRSSHRTSQASTASTDGVTSEDGSTKHMGGNSGTASPDAVDSDDEPTLFLEPQDMRSSQYERPRPTPLEIPDCSEAKCIAHTDEVEEHDVLPAGQVQVPLCLRRVMCAVDPKKAIQVNNVTMRRILALQKGLSKRQPKPQRTGDRRKGQEIAAKASKSPSELAFRGNA